MALVLGPAHSLELVLAAPETTSKLPWQVNYADFAVGIPQALASGNLYGLTSGTTAVTVCPPPFGDAARKVRQITVQNADTVNATVTLRFNDGSRTYAFPLVTLQPGDHMQYEDGATVTVFDKNMAPR